MALPLLFWPSSSVITFALNSHGCRFTIIHNNYTSTDIVSLKVEKLSTCLCSPPESNHADQWTLKSLPLGSIQGSKEAGKFLAARMKPLLYAGRTDRHMERPLLLHVVCSDDLGMNISQQMSLQSELQISRLRKSPNSHISQPWNTKKTLLKKKKPTKQPKPNS